MKYINISALTLCLAAFSMTATAQNVTLHKQGGVGQVYEVEKVDSVVYFPIGDTEQFPAPEVENSTTLWDVIKAQPNLKKFAAILEAASYYTGKGKAASYLQFSKLLSGSVPVSVYAPTDAAISEDKYAELMALAKTDGWKLQQEFVFNHISPQESTGTGNGSIQMLNGKMVAVNANDVTFINQECNNGKLYTMTSYFPYLSNMAEYLLEIAPDCSIAQEFMAAFGGAGKTFDTKNSIALPSKDGNMLVLDSVFSTHNQIMDQYFVYDNLMQVKGFGVDLANENASYNMILPTDAVWSQAQAKLAPLYTYANKYEDKEKGDVGMTSYIDLPNPDSLSALSVGADILVPLLGKTATGQETRLSNGVAYTPSEWSVPQSEYCPDLEVELTGKEFFNIYSTSIYYKVGADTRLVSFDNSIYSDIANQYGHVSGNNFFYLAPPGVTANPHVEIKLAGENGEQVMSGKYDVYVVMVPYWYSIISEKGSIDEVFNDQNYIDSISAITKMCFTVQIRYNNNASNGKDATSRKSATIEYNGTRVDTLIALEDFVFPYSYKNMRISYPTLIIDGATRAASAKNGFMYGLCIDKIILRSKEDGSETIVTP